MQGGGLCLEVRRLGPSLPFVFHYIFVPFHRAPIESPDPPSSSASSGVVPPQEAPNEWIPLDQAPFDAWATAPVFFVRDADHGKPRAASTRVEVERENLAPMSRYTKWEAPSLSELAGGSDLKPEQICGHLLEP